MSDAFKFECEAPVEAECDVLVTGGGPGGLGAAVMAARAGAKTILAERFGFLGGMAVAGEVSPFMPNHFNADPSAKGSSWRCDNEICMDRPVYLEWIKAMASYLPPRLREKALADAEARAEGRTISKEAAALAAEDLCLKAGVKLLYHHTLVKAFVENGRIAGAAFHTKSGFVAIKAKVYVDSSGDGDLAALAGCGFELGECQPMTLCFKLSNIERSKTPPWDEIQRLHQKAKESGALDCPRENLLVFETDDPSILHFNTTRIVGKSGVDGQSLSEAEIEGRRQLRQYLAWLRGSVSGFENAKLHSMASHIGVRETRKIDGLAKLTREDFMKRSKFKDAIARCNYPVDIHSSRGAGTELVHMPHQEYYEIPYGCIVAKDISNLAIGSRCISVDRAVHSSMRVMPPVCSVGQAAGFAAAVAAREGKALKELDGAAVRAGLKAQGAWL